MADPMATSHLTDRRRAIAAIGTLAASLVACVARGKETSLAAASILDAIPAGWHAAIRRGTLREDLGRLIDSAAIDAAQRGIALHFAAGTYPMRNWQVPSGLLVLTDGPQTIFRQLDTQGRPQRFIEVFGSDVRLWPGSSATIDGGMTDSGTNATAFNSGIRVHARHGVRIDSFECGDVYGRDLGGDVLETGCDAGGYLGSCKIGSVHGDNVYRNIVSITGGAMGSIAAVIQQSGCGLLVLDVEPDASSARVGMWTIGRVVGHRAAIAGDAAAGIDSVRIASLDLDGARPSSVPAFDKAGVNRSASQTLFEVGLRYRNVGTIRIDRARISRMPRAAIEDIGLGTKDQTSGSLSLGSLEIVACGSRSTYEIVTQRTALVDIGNLQSVAKPARTVATFLSGFAVTRIRVARGQVNGTVVLESKADLALESLTVDAGEAPAFRNLHGRLNLANSEVTSRTSVFDTSTGPIEVVDSMLSAPVIGRGSTKPRLIRSRLRPPSTEI